MQLSAKAEYACLAMAELAKRHDRGNPTSLKEIAQELGLSHPFLMQIFLVLKSARLVKGLRGPGGGFRLGRSPESASILDIVEVIDGPGDGGTAIDSLPNAPLVQSLRHVEQAARHAAKEVLKMTTLGDLARQSQETGSL